MMKRDDLLSAHNDGVGEGEKVFTEKCGMRIELRFCDM